MSLTIYLGDNGHPTAQGGQRLGAFLNTVRPLVD